MAGAELGEINLRDDKLAALKKVSNKYEMAGGAIVRLRKLENFDIVVVADDSGSMNHKVDGGRTRYQELAETVVMICEVACCLDQDGIDLYFMNQPPVYNVHDIKACRELFNKGPSGTTPSTATYRRVLQEKVQNVQNEKGVLILFATDGEPNSMKDFLKILKTRDGQDPAKFPTTIMACTDDDKAVGWLNKLDGDYPYIDVVDDYASERKEVRKAQGASFPFSKGDYLVKMLIGSMDPLYDNLDEKKLTREQYVEYAGCEPPADWNEPAPSCGCAIM